MNEPRQTSDRVADIVEGVASQLLGGYSTLLSDNHGTWDPVLPAEQA